MKASAYILLRKDYKNKDNETPVIMRVVINSQKRDYGLNFSVIKIILILKVNHFFNGSRKNSSIHVSINIFVSVLLNLGILFKVVSKLLGHSDLKTTKIYSRFLNLIADTEMLK